MKSPLTWVGGKSRLAAKIVEMIPVHEHYAEVFCGASWVFFRKPRSRFESLNDINSDLIRFYRCVQNHPQELCRQYSLLLNSRELFQDFQSQQKGRGLTDIQRAARFYYLQRQAFGGKVVGQVFGVSVLRKPNMNFESLKEEFDAVHKRLAGVVIEHLPWADYLERYDSPGTFFYLDPPYWDSEDYYGKNVFRKSDYARMAKQLGVLDARFVLSLNDRPEVRRIFAGFEIRHVDTTYSVSSENCVAAGEVLISNFKLCPKQGELLLTAETME